ncbi:sensor histidine kinase NtrY-like [Gimibacter soli]|uniref:histidine kinase n=1 Tax=Gimibacter soli TaxID=3024400 RepID=A0AAE9XUF3_9PROT|nr:PAS domain-containing sensor histidine kinase [Gimibacter soli]WCL52929.1 PAS domain-containing sensor histidine kinase [Gimibacter soli]
MEPNSPEAAGQRKPRQKKDLMDLSPKLPSRRVARFLLWSRRVNFGGRLEIALSVLAVIAAVVTYVAMSRKGTPLEATSGRTMTVLLYVNLALLLALGASIGRWFVRFWIARKANAAGSKLHTRMIGFFMGIAIVPPIIMAVFSSLFLEFGIQTWFSEKVRSTLNNSLEVAETYLIEHRSTIEKDMLAIALAFNRLSPSQQFDQLTVQRVADTALSTRLLSEVMLIEDRDGEGSVLARATSGLDFRTQRFEVEMINRVREGEAFIASNAADNTIIGMIRLSSFLRPTYLYVARDLNPQVVGYLEATRNAVADYDNLEGRRSNVQLQFSVVFIIVSLLILLAAIWIGLWFSGRLFNPLSELVDAAERVGAGDLTARVRSVTAGDEVGTLSRTFNRMTDQLARHQADLITANRELDDRRRFLEEVLAGVSAGVIGLDSERRIFLPNKSAAALLGVEIDVMLGRRLDEAFPAFAALLDQTVEGKSDTVQGQVQIDVGDSKRTLLARVSVDRTSEGAPVGGFVVTFDDLTEQLADQRTAAWADVARRIAHEIKNPLTPIQLSAERLKRKYLKEITTDPAVFSQCTDTIIRQVGDLRRMVDEFSSFARMPAPLFKETDIVDVVRQAVFLQNVSWPQVNFLANLPEEPLVIDCDGRLLGQAFTNLLKNAAESIESRMERDRASGSDTLEPGQVHVSINATEDLIEILVTDNGMGLPQDQKDRLMEPYVTTRVKGTGLGLAIVRRIVEEHGGTVRIADQRPLGAVATVSLSRAALRKRLDRQGGHEEAAE